MAVSQITAAASWRRVSFIRISLVQYFLNTVSCSAGNRSLTVAARVGGARQEPLPYGRGSHRGRASATAPLRSRLASGAKIPLLMFQRFHGRLLHHGPRRGIA